MIILFLKKIGYFILYTVSIEFNILMYFVMYDIIVNIHFESEMLYWWFIYIYIYIFFFSQHNLETDLVIEYFIIWLNLSESQSLNSVTKSVIKIDHKISL
jgi:hypothetical protein